MTEQVTVIQKLRQIWRTLLLEGLAVLLGVLLAFWVDSLGQDYEERQKANQFLSSLQSELELTIKQLDDLISQGREQVKVIQTGLKTTILPPDGVNPTAEDLRELIIEIGPNIAIPYQRAALDDILGSGGLLIIEDEEIRLAILTYSRLIDSEHSHQQNAIAFWNDRLSPYYFKYANISGFIIADDLELKSPEPEMERFVRNRHFSNLIAERAALTRRLTAIRKELQAQAKPLSELIQPAS